MSRNSRTHSVLSGATLGRVVPCFQRKLIKIGHSPEWEPNPETLCRRKTVSFIYLFYINIVYIILGVNPELLETLLYSELDDASKSTSKETPSREEIKETSEQKKSDSFNALLISKLMAIANSSCKPGKHYFYIYLYTE